MRLRAMEEGQEMERLIAFVLLDQPVVIDKETLAEAIRSRHPDMSVEVTLAPAKPGQEPGSVAIIRFGGELAMMMAMPAPLPQDAGKGVWPRLSAVVWPDAPAVAQHHRAHLIVSTIDTGQPLLRFARIITAITGALVAVSPGCLGVVWDAQVAHPPERWRDMSRNAFAPSPDFPLTLWVGIHPFRSETGVGAVTSGLRPFVNREVELEGRSDDLRNVINKIAGLAGYLIEHGDVIRDGATFGSSETERLKVSHAVSTRFAGLPVLRAVVSAP
jgi:hypothetical protein